MEQLYHVNELDEVIGSVDRDRAHSEEMLHRSGIVFLQRLDREILIQHRSPRKTIFPGCYDASAAFHIAFGETYAEAADRELEEETGISTELRYIGKFKHHDPPELQLVAVFIGASDRPVKIDRSEASDAVFCSKQEVERIVAFEKITPWFRDGWKIVRDLV
jgi:isopentenyldiphosphate isomerase